MVIFLSAAIAVLLLMNIWQFVSRRTWNRNVQEISNKIMEIIEHQTAEKVLFQTDQQAVQQLLIQINRLLDYNQRVIADYARTKDSLKKMISNMSHDLKTPLTVILGYAEKLNQEESITEEERKQVILRLNDKVNSLVALLNQFFDLVKIESEDYEIPLSKISLNEICRQSVLEFYELLTSRGLRVELEIPERPLYILANEHALQRILNNLISNSIRYGSDGGVFGLTLREEGESVAVDVWDRGKGITEVHQDRVFERLYTLDDARNPQFQGSGLGLSISKRLTEAMKGSIRLTSTPFEKTTFTCIFKQVPY
ncbi:MULTISPECIES: sensor histidine kinase KdpD [Paenibacillus]|uniref:sensor histidine kinase n=1 Tax=Paenibacillus TaxID=44249 RepID=UPI000E276941|nr:MULTISPECIES: sensor histidine kinase [Paenibacillus]MCM2997547.1 sensor histidine kinase [Paenibacillus cellulositrophicus]RED41274.1 signal transduction histidine kinase [Paenibacillus sp. VMFN-D1]